MEISVLITAVLIALSCAWVGSFLLFRGLAMMGDALSHSVLPGLVLAYLISGSRHNIAMLLGAVLVGLLTAVFIEWLATRMKVKGDAAIGLAYTSFFALGIVLITRYTAGVDLDQDCVLYGELLYVPFDGLKLFGISWGPKALYTSLFMFLVVVFSLILGYKGLKISSFQPDYAASLGLSMAFWHYGLMGLTSMVTVFSFESVGALLVVGFLVVPGAAAWLMVKDLKKLLVIAAVISVLSCILGYALALLINSALAPAIGSVMGVFFTGAVVVHLFAKKRSLRLMH